MKIIAVGDIHGRDTWKAIAEKHADFDKFIFVGDYFDNWPPMTSKKILKNFSEILQFKIDNPDRVVLVMGNHDFQYTPMGEGEQYSGYDTETKLNLKSFGEWWTQTVPAYQYKDVLFIHGGLSNTWLNDNMIVFKEGENIGERLTEIFKLYPELFKFNRADTSHCGDDVRQGPFWIRPDALLTDMYPIQQVVGHTHTDKVKVIDDKLIMIDTGRAAQEYLTITDDVIDAGTL